jgi:hypothetical protein
MRHRLVGSLGIVLCLIGEAAAAHRAKNRRVELVEY